VLAVRSHFFEFLPVGSDGEPDIACPQLAHELDSGQEYSVVLTTGGGLHRYHLGDVVKVTGRLRECPTVTFVGRSRVVDWRGEKLHEAHVARVLAAALHRAGIAPSFSMLAFDGRGYVLYLDSEATPPLAKEVETGVETGLAENFHYRYARDLGQVLPVRICPVRNGQSTFVAACVARGQRAGAVKFVALDAHDDWTARFNATSRPGDVRQRTS
jgi:hypothetical protein